MPKHQRRDNSPPVASQRQLRADAVMRRLSGSMIVFFVSSATAIAEVCDKVAGENWRIGDPPITIVRTIYDMAPSWQVFVVCGLLLLGALRALWLGYLGLVIFALAAGLTVWAYGYPDDVMRGGIEEGCVSWKPDARASIVLFCIAVLYGASVWWMASRRRRTATQVQWTGP